MPIQTVQQNQQQPNVGVVNPMAPQNSMQEQYMPSPYPRYGASPAAMAMDPSLMVSRTDQPTIFESIRSFIWDAGLTAVTVLAAIMVAPLIYKGFARVSAPLKELTAQKAKELTDIKQLKKFVKGGRISMGNTLAKAHSATGEMRVKKTPNMNFSTRGLSTAETSTILKGLRQTTTTLGLDGYVYNIKIHLNAPSARITKGVEDFFKGGEALESDDLEKISAISFVLEKYKKGATGLVSSANPSGDIISTTSQKKFMGIF